VAFVVGARVGAIVESVAVLAIFTCGARVGSTVVGNIVMFLVTFAVGEIVDKPGELLAVVFPASSKVGCFVSIFMVGADVAFGIGTGVVSFVLGGSVGTRVDLKFVGDGVDIDGTAVSVGE
jgi:hypothetical protein